MIRGLSPHLRLPSPAQALGVGLLAGCLFGACASSPAPPGEANADAEAEAEADEAKPAAEKTKPAEAAALPDRDPVLACRLVREEGAVLLDVRTPEEFAEGHVEGAVNIPHDQIDARAAEIDGLQGGDKGKPIVVYCRSGKRAGVAKQSLVDGGRTQVTNLGGLSDWPECPG